MPDFTSLLEEQEEKPKVGRNFAVLLEEQQRTDQAAAVSLDQVDVDRSGLEDAVLRFQLARADSFEEKQLVFQKAHPRGELVQLREQEPLLSTGRPTSGEVSQFETRDELVFKFDTTDPNERFKSIERGDLEDPTLGEVGRDLAEFFGEDAGAITGEVAAAIATRGGSLFRTGLKEAGGAVLGEFADQGIQELEGVNTQSLRDVSRQAGQQGAITLGGATIIGGAIKGGINIGRGSGLLQTKPGSVEAEQARQLINQRLPDGQQIPEFTPGQLTETPILQRLDEQSIALAGGLRQQRRDQTANVARATKTAAPPRDLVTARKNATAALNKAENKLKRDLNGKGDFEGAGDSLQDALINPETGYRATSGRAVTDLYEVAAAQGDATFDLAGPLTVAAEIKRGTRATARQVEGPEGVLIDQPPVNVAGSLETELNSVISDLEKIDPAFPGGRGIDAPWKILKDLRSRLFDLKTPAPGTIFTTQHRQANELYKSITNTLDAPQGGDAAFVKAWDDARFAAKKRYDNLELSTIVQLAKTDTPIGFAQKLAQPGAADSLRNLGRVLNEKTMREVTDAFKLDLANNLPNFTNTWQSFDKETLRRLLRPDEIRLFQRISDDLAKLDSTGIDTALGRQSRNRLFVRDLINRSDSTGVSALKDLIRANGGKRGPLGRSISAGIVDDIFEDVATIQASGGTITASNLSGRMRELDNLGFGPILSAQDRAFVKAIVDIAPFIKITRGGAGASLQAAEAASGIISVGDPKQQLGALFTIIQKIGYARTMRSAAMRKLLIGSGKTKIKPTRTLSAIGATLALALTDIEEQEKIPVLQ